MISLKHRIFPMDSKSLGAHQPASWNTTAIWVIQKSRTTFTISCDERIGEQQQYSHTSKGSPTISKDISQAAHSCPSTAVFPPELFTAMQMNMQGGRMQPSAPKGDQEFTSSQHTVYARPPKMVLDRIQHTCSNTDPWLTMELVIQNQEHGSSLTSKDT